MINAFEIIIFSEYHANWIFMMLNPSNSKIACCSSLAVTPVSLGPYSQNFLSQICKFFVALGLNMLRFLSLKVFL